MVIYHRLLHSRNLGCEVCYFSKLHNHQRIIFWISPFGCGSWEAVLAAGEGGAKKREGLIGTGRWLGFVTVTSISVQRNWMAHQQVWLSFHWSALLPSQIICLYNNTPHTDTHSSTDTHWRDIGTEGESPEPQILLKILTCQRGIIQGWNYPKFVFQKDPSFLSQANWSGPLACKALGLSLKLVTIVCQCRRVGI